MINVAYARVEIGFNCEFVETEGKDNERDDFRFVSNYHVLSRTLGFHDYFKLTVYRVRDHYLAIIIGGL